MTDKAAKKIEITICMGSSCFSRGNNKTLHLIKKYIDANELGEEIKITGSLCEGKCNCGPHITIDGKRYDNITPETAIDIIRDKG
jgi:NADH:ubiquinone oxidoreductase subunit E